MTKIELAQKALHEGTLKWFGYEQLCLFGFTEEIINRCLSYGIIEEKVANELMKLI